MLRLPRLFGKFLGLRLQTYASYRADAFLMAGSALLVDGLGLVFINVVFSQVPEIEGWTRYEVLLTFGLVVFSGGVTQLFFDGLWTIGSSVHRGRFDVFLTRPLPALFSVITFWMSPEGVGTAILGATICAAALVGIGVEPTAGGAAAALILVASGIAVRVAVTLVVNTLGFWTSGPLASGVGDISEPLYTLVSYPLSIYGRIFGLTLTAVIPLAFVGFAPATFIARGPSGNEWVLAAPLVAAATWAVALSLFRFGLRRYESVGGFHQR